MPSTLTDRLRASHRQQFTGRNDETSLFEEALEAHEWPFHVLYVHGPGGVGKTTLLHAFERRCEDRDVAAFYLNARGLAPSVPDLKGALEEVLYTSSLTEGLAAHASDHDKFILLIDTYEAITPLDRWFRETLVPSLPQNALLVLSGRRPPSAEWRADPGLQSLMHRMPLRNLEPEASRQYLRQRRVPADQHETVLRFAHGHPLALSLVADAFDQHPDLQFEPDSSPNLIGTLLHRFVDQVPSAQHREALEACALVHSTTEESLAALLETSMEKAHDYFAWLRSLSFIKTSPDGLFPHDLARTVIAADQRWRTPEQSKALRLRAQSFYIDKLKQLSSHKPRAVLSEYLYALRDNSVVRPFFQQLQAQWHDGARYVEDAPRPDDWPILRDMVAHHEGEEAACLFDFWRERQPDRLRVYRDGQGQPVGLSWPLALHEIEERDHDPAVQAAFQHVDEEAPLREEEHGTLFRFWMAREAYQDVSPVQSLIFAHTVRYYLTADHLAYSFLYCAAPNQWALPLAYADFQQLDDATFTIGDRTFGLFGHDWRKTPPATWLNMLAERNITTPSVDAVPSAPDATMLVLNESDFAKAVKEALSDYPRPKALHDNPLLRSRFILEETDPEAEESERAAALRDLLQEAAESLKATPREAKFYRALHATYLDPAPTQQQAAEQLEIPFSTYRRHLKRGIGHVTELLWRRETTS